MVILLMVILGTGVYVTERLRGRREDAKIEWYALRFANFCYEYGYLEPRHEFWEQFLENGPEYYNAHVEHAKADGKKAMEEAK